MAMMTRWVFLFGIRGGFGFVMTGVPSSSMGPWEFPYKPTMLGIHVYGNPHVIQDSIGHEKTARTPEAKKAWRRFLFSTLGRQGAEGAKEIRW